MPIFQPGGSLLLPLQNLLAGWTFERVPYTGSVDERVSAQLRDQLPDFILENYSTFQSFLNAYFEWMEFYGNPRGEGVRLATYKDVDETLEQFLEYFRSTFLRNLPKELADGINERNLVKNIRYLYTSKGTKASFDLLFRILFNTTVDVDYPKDRILKPSTSTFDDRKFIRLLSYLSIEDMKKLESTIIIQRSPQDRIILATGLVDGVEFVSRGGIDFYSLSLQTVSGEFNSNYKVDVTPVGSSTPYKLRILPTLTSVQINAGGSGYNIGDELVVKDLYNNELLRGFVDTIGPKNEIRGFNYTDNFGVYTNNSGFTYTIETAGGVGASLSPTSENVISDGPDRYFDETGKISGRSFIQDNFFYQNFSYVLTVNKALDKFSDTVRSLIHPAGTQLFARLLNETNFNEISVVDSETNIEALFSRVMDQSTSNLSFFQPVIGHYLPHTFGTTHDPRGFTFTTGSGSTHYDFYPRGYNGLDGRTFDDFFGATVGDMRNIPHTVVEYGITHNPDEYYVGSSMGNIETIASDIYGTPTAFNLPVGYFSLGCTGLNGLTYDSDGENAGPIGQFPVDSNRRFKVVKVPSGPTFYGGYTAPVTTGLTVGLSGGQIIQVQGTDSATSDYWIVYRHVNALENSGVTQTGIHRIYEIPLLPVVSTSISSPRHGDRSGYGEDYQNTGLTLNGGATFAVGEIVRQRRYNEPEAIGRVRLFRAGSYTQNLPDGSSGPDGLLGNPIWNIGIDYLSIEVLNGQFSFAEDSTGISRPVVGDDNGCARLISNTFKPNTYTSMTHEVAWTDIPISLIVNEIPY